MKSQLQKGAELWTGQSLTSKTQFLAQNQSCGAKKLRHPQKAQLLMLKHIVSKDEVPTPKGGWVMAWTTFVMKNRIEEEEIGQIQ